VPDGVRRGVLVVGTLAGSSKVFKTGETAGAKDFNSTGGIKEFFFSLTDSSLQSLINMSTTVTANGSTYTTTFKEKVGDQFDVLFDSSGNGNVADLEGLIHFDDMNYTVDLGSGIPRDYTRAPGDFVRIPFFGELWDVKLVDLSANLIVLERVIETSTNPNTQTETS